MKIEEFEAFNEGMVGVMSFYNKDLSRFAMDVWWNALKPFDLSAVTSAFSRHLINPDSGQFPPKPGDIVKMLSGSTADQATTAWAKVDRAVRQVGTYASVVFDDPLIHRVMHDMGGWLAFGQKTENDWPFVAREFETRYRGFALRGENPDYPKVMIGLSEAYNSRKGFGIDAPRLIGNAERAVAVMNGGSDAPLLEMRPMSEATGVVLRLVDKPGVGQAA